MAPPTRGEIWSVRLPAKPDHPHQPRPALVVSSDYRNQVADDLIVIPIFSIGAESPTHVRLARGQGGIKKDSVLFCEELTTLTFDFLVRGPWGPPVDAAILRSAVRAVRRAIGEVVPEPL
ncbi:MAG: hypothetical protein AUH85_09635 [Chloroflexi bacterium 13_1_40CM_4_68_4]|nr:MAG: hypothetical protein AUH85_09635 [Chloroflexi bacterium 13_1_40CM_4_68_4]